MTMPAAPDPSKITAKPASGPAVTKFNSATECVQGCPAAKSKFCEVDVLTVSAGFGKKTRAVTVPIRVRDARYESRDVPAEIQDLLNNRFEAVIDVLGVAPSSDEPTPEPIELRGQLHDLGACEHALHPSIVVKGLTSARMLVEGHEQKPKVLPFVDFLQNGGDAQCSVYPATRKYKPDVPTSTLRTLWVLFDLLMNAKEPAEYSFTGWSCGANPHADANFGVSRHFAILVRAFRADTFELRFEVPLRSVTERVGLLPKKAPSAGSAESEKPRDYSFGIVRSDPRVEVDRDNLTHEIKEFADGYAKEHGQFTVSLVHTDAAGKKTDLSAKWLGDVKRSVELYLMRGFEFWTKIIDVIRQLRRFRIGGSIDADVSFGALSVSGGVQLAEAGPRAKSVIGGVDRWHPVVQTGVLKVDLQIVELMVAASAGVKCLIFEHTRAESGFDFTIEGKATIAVELHTQIPWEGPFEAEIEPAFAGQLKAVAKVAFAGNKLATTLSIRFSMEGKITLRKVVVLGKPKLDIQAGALIKPLVCEAVFERGRDSYPFRLELTRAVPIGAQ